MTVSILVPTNQLNSSFKFVINMQRFLPICFALFLHQFGWGQKISVDTLGHKMANTFENIQVKKIAEDSNQSSFIIWVKKEVKPHYHQYHSEYIHVLSGSATMQLGADTFKIQQGDIVFIPQRSIHSVKTNSTQPLKVISIQTPKFDGDRVWVYD